MILVAWTLSLLLPCSGLLSGLVVVIYSCSFCFLLGRLFSSSLSCFVLYLYFCLPHLLSFQVPCFRLSCLLDLSILSFSSFRSLYLVFLVFQIFCLVLFSSRSLEMVGIILHRLRLFSIIKNSLWVFRVIFPSVSSWLRIFTNLLLVFLSVSYCSRSSRSLSERIVLISIFAESF